MKYLIFPMPRSMIRNLFVFLLMGSFLVRCTDDPTTKPENSACNPADQPGELISAEFLITVTPAQIQQYLADFGAPITFTVDYSVDAYALLYRSRDKQGNLTDASGVIFIPQDIDTLDLTSMQHGTVFRRSDVGSENALIAFDALLMSMKGYLVAAPDYLGLGSSQLLHPYLHAELSANSVIDMLRATRIYACENELLLSDKLFMAGYSEGGFVTLATQKEIETHYSDEFTLTAVAPMAGPYDLVGSTRQILSQDSYNNPAFLAYLVVAYNDIYEWDRLGDIFNEPFASQLPDLFDGTNSGETINGALTSSIDSLFNSDFRNAFLAGEEVDLNTALLENSFQGWGPIAPVLLIHGTADETVAYANSEFVYASLIENGGLSVNLVPLSGATHLTGALTSFFIAQDWFSSF